MDFFLENGIKPNLSNAMYWYLRDMFKLWVLQYGIINWTEERNMGYTRIYCALLLKDICRRPIIMQLLLIVSFIKELETCLEHTTKVPLHVGYNTLSQTIAQAR
jgi:hypothetical protein